MTRLQYLRARYYAPETAGFITRDSVLGRVDSVNSQNRYSFAEADPVNNADPSGHAVGKTSYERQMEAAGGINEIYNLYVGQTLQNSYNRAASAFNSKLNHAYGVDYTSQAAINSISGISQATANHYIESGAAATMAAGRSWGCIPGDLTRTAIVGFAANVNATRTSVNTRIGQVKANKQAQYNQYQAYLAYLAYAAEQARRQEEGAARLAAWDAKTRARQLSLKVESMTRRVTDAFRGVIGSAFGKGSRTLPLTQIPARPVESINIHTLKPVDRGDGRPASGHEALDVIGLFPLIGEPFDFINSVWYAAEGDASNASLSLGAVIPGVGWVPAGIKAAKAGKVAANAGEEAAAAGAKGLKNGERVVNPPKAASPVWKKFENVKGSDIKTDGIGRNEKYYKWDNLHNDIEVFDVNKKHLGSMDPITGEMYKPPVAGREL